MNTRFARLELNPFLPRANKVIADVNWRPV